MRQTVNTGFCGGQNAALQRAAGDWILFLNPDVVLPPDFVERAIALADRSSSDVATIAPSIRLPDGRVDSTGLVMDRLRRAWDRDHGLPLSSATTRGGDVFGCTGAVALHRRTMLEDVAVDRKPLDEGMFAYYDDLDLAWRARLRGWRCEYAPDLVATHYREARNALRGRRGRHTRARDQVLTVRNRLLTMVKCAAARDLVLELPLLAAFEAVRIGYLAVRTPSALRGYSEFLSHLPEALAARREIQSRRRAEFPATDPRAVARS
jgi:GT2 family glycosyltransferase